MEKILLMCKIEIEKPIRIKRHNIENHFLFRGFSPIGILAHVCGSAASAVLSSNPATAEAAEGAKEMVNALFGGVEITEDENNMQTALFQAIDNAWKVVQQKYDLTDPCMTDLKTEIMGTGTSVDSFMRNSESHGLNDAIAIVVKSILLKHVNEFRRDTKHTWTEAYTENASKDIANILVDSVNGVFSTNDSLLLLKAIRDSDAKRHQEHQEINKKLEQIQDGLDSVSRKNYDIPQCLTPIPSINHEVGLVGRDDIKRKVRDMLEENDRMALVNGLGGIGKTAVMEHVCNDLKNEGKYVAWIECGESLKEDLLLLRAALGIPNSDDADTAYAKIVNILKSNRQFAENVYLFMDNLSRALREDEQSILNSLRVHVMATSRFEHDYFANLPLDTLVEESALDMFYGYYLEKQKDKTRRYKDAALDIIRSVQCHTLLVELLAKAAWKKGGTLEAFRDSLKTDGVFEVFKRKLSTKHDKNRTIEECVMELYKISRLTPAQQHIMRTPEKEIYYEILHWADLDEDATDELVDLGWLERGGRENGYRIHQIVKESLTRQMKKDGENVKLDDYGEFLSKVIYTDSYLGRNVPYEKILERLTLVEDIARFLNENNREDVDVGALFNNMAGVYNNQGNYEKALEYFGKALAIRERVLGTEHPDTAVTYNNIASVFRTQGEYKKALEYFEKALAIREWVLRTEPPDMAVTYNNMAGVYKDLGEYKKALEYYGKALAIKERVFGTEHPSTAVTYNNMAGVFRTQGDYKKALEYYGKDLSISERVLGTEHPDTAVTYNNMAGVYEDLGEYEKALEYYGKALSISERVLGTEHPDTAVMYNNMAGVFYAQGEYEKALEYYGKALAIHERVLGTEHSDTAATYNNIANVFRAQGEYEKTLEYYGKALAISERVFGTEHSFTAVTYNNMADVFCAQGKYEKALEYYGKAFAISERVFGTEHPDTAVTYNNMADVFCAQGEYKKSLEYYGKALAIREQVFGMEHPDTAVTYNNMAGVYEDLGKYEKALKYYQKALTVFLAVFGEEHPHTKVVQWNLTHLRDKMNQ